MAKAKKFRLDTLLPFWTLIQLCLIKIYLNYGYACFRM